MESARVFQREQMYMDEMRGVSVVRMHFRYWGRSSSNERVPMGVSGISCDSGTKLSLGPNCYFTCSLIYSQNPTLGYMLLVPPMPLTVALANYVLVHCPVHCIASPPSEVLSGRVHQSQGFQNGNLLSHTPISVQ